MLHKCIRYVSVLLSCGKAPLSNIVGMQNEGLLLFKDLQDNLWTNFYTKPELYSFSTKNRTDFFLERVETYWSLEACIDGCLERLDIVIY